MNRWCAGSTGPNGPNPTTWHPGKATSVGTDKTEVSTRARTDPEHAAPPRCPLHGLRTPQESAKRTRWDLAGPRGRAPGVTVVRASRLETRADGPHARSEHPVTAFHRHVQLLHARAVAPTG